MSGKFHSELIELCEQVSKMAKLARDMLCQSVDALVKQDEALAEKIRSKKEELRIFDGSIEEKALQLIALYQPMATDMRTIACVLKMITYLTRIGRYGKDNANIAIELSNQPHVKKLISLPHMRDIVCSMIDDALKAFETMNLDVIKDIADRDDVVDELYYSIFRECLTYMLEDQKTISRCVNYIMMARYLERCGDHACKMAEKIHYMVNGEHVEIK
ncbi:MAG: phosphate signaling complex protein PhoU [Promethearchaeota archaeon]|nr:MAG: phosphate signaling complex protein PhoU [Candidatus Lokiarchaeota archaeon]